MAERFHKLVRALFFCPTPIDARSPLDEGAFLVYPHHRSRMGVGYFQGCPPVTTESTLRSSRNQTLKSHPIF